MTEKTEEANEDKTEGKSPGRPAKQHCNRLVRRHLRAHNNWCAADRKIPGFQDVLSGACWLGVRGNKGGKRKGQKVSASGEKDKPFAMGEMFRLLRTLPVISTQAVMEVARCEDANARKIANCLRIISKRLEPTLRGRELDELWGSEEAVTIDAALLADELARLEEELAALNEGRHYEGEDSDLDALAHGWDDQFQQMQDAHD